MVFETHGKRAGALAFAVPLIVYVLTLCPTVYWDDAGELITAAYTLGIPHPPGHPLFALTGKLFTFIPHGSIAWRVNLMSAFFGALTCFLIYKIITDRLEENPWRPMAALGGALFFAFAPTMWEQSTVAETSTLHSFFMMLLTLLIFRLASGRMIWKNETRSLCLFSFVYGLSFTNHVAGLFFLPSFVYLLLLTYGRRIFQPRLLAQMALSFFVALIVYAYLPIRSLADPAIDWGNPETVRNFLWVVTARQFAPNIAPKLNVYTIGSNLTLRGTDLLRQFTVAGCALGIVGACALYRREKRVVIFSVFIIGVLSYIGLNSAFISAYFIPALALIAVWIGVGLHRALNFAEHLARWLKPATFGMAARHALCAVLAVSFAYPLGMNYGNMDKSDDRYALRYGEQLMAQLPEGSAFFTVDGYALFILWYLKYCENRRPDLMVIEPTWLSSSGALSSQVFEQYPELVLPSSDIVAKYVARATNAGTRQFLIIQSVLDANAHRPIYWGIISENIPFLRNLVPQGIVYRYSVEPVEMQGNMLTANTEFWESESDWLRSHPEMLTERSAVEIYPVELNNLGLLFEELGRDDLSRWAIELALEFNPDYPISRYNLGRLEARAGNYEAAFREYRRAIAGNPCMAVAYYNLGNAYRSVGRLDEAFLAYRQAARLYPRYHEAITALGQLYSVAGQTEDAVQQFRKALKIEPAYPFALRGLASVYLQMNSPKEAREPLEKSLQIEPNSAAGLFALAKYHALLGDSERAKKALRRSIEIGGVGYIMHAQDDVHLRRLAEESVFDDT
ncbi:MAG: DUF2723 domain-containing protein [Candidatus Abyssobacteria bacterium SURF_17]|uniref:DUF2723 domain-containing protein n=1 Tax=Candidatus Abyssobacteria bacterium SURF_17 TaxID=2093361 RepID=A0A419F8L4_9BACT|nr:MAG: DUF2723 domain-containing protein [Candidatus Abyssubacteria bacterium SURF_17]